MHFVAVEAYDAHVTFVWFDRSSKTVDFLPQSTWLSFLNILNKIMSDILSAISPHLRNALRHLPVPRGPFSIPRRRKPVLEGYDRVSRHAGVTREKEITMLDQESNNVGSDDNDIQMSRSMSPPDVAQDFGQSSEAELQP